MTDKTKPASWAPTENLFCKLRESAPERYGQPIDPITPPKPRIVSEAETRIRARLRRRYIRKLWLWQTFNAVCFICSLAFAIFPIYGMVMDPDPEIAMACGLASIIGAAQAFVFALFLEDAWREYKHVRERGYFGERWDALDAMKGKDH